MDMVIPTDPTGDITDHTATGCKHWRLQVSFYLVDDSNSHRYVSSILKKKNEKKGKYKIPNH